MWEIITSQGHRARDIQHESDAMRTVHSLGLTTLIAPGRYLVSDQSGPAIRRGNTLATGRDAASTGPAVLPLNTAL